MIDILENSPEVRANPSYMRRLNQICCQISVLEHPSASEGTLASDPLYSDVSCLNLLASATKGLTTLQEMLTQYEEVNKGMQHNGLAGHSMLGSYVGGLNAWAGGNKSELEAMLEVN